MLPDQYSPKNVLPGVAIVVVVYVYSNLSTTTTAKKKKRSGPVAAILVAFVCEPYGKLLRCWKVRENGGKGGDEMGIHF